MRPIWSGALSFGLINIPIRLYSGSHTSRVNLDMLHKKDLSPIRYAIVCKLEEKEIPYKDVVKGYKYEEGEYVTVSPEDFESIAMEKSDRIEIQSFADESEVDSVFYERPYFLEPVKGGAKAYVLLRDALTKSKKIAIVKFIIRNRIHIGTIKAYEDLLVLNQLRYKSEINPTKSLEIPKKEKVSSKELNMAIKLIEQLVEPFKPEKFEDTYAESLDLIIKAKLKGKKITSKKKRKKKEEIETLDIMSKLKESLSHHRTPRVSRRHAL